MADKYFRKIIFMCVMVLCYFVIVSCNGADDEGEGIDNASYSNLELPDYSAINPVRYLKEDERLGQYDGWQDFGKSGEICTHMMPRSTYTYQMYSYFIRNDLAHLYGKADLPDSVNALPEWIAKITDGRRAFWYSMGRLPEAIEFVSVSDIKTEDGSKSFVKAEYKITVSGTNQESVEKEWIVYFSEDGEKYYNAYAIEVNEGYETVEAMADSIIKSYKLK